MKNFKENGLQVGLYSLGAIIYAMAVIVGSYCLSNLIVLNQMQFNFFDSIELIAAGVVVVLIAATVFTMCVNDYLKSRNTCF